MNNDGGQAYPCAETQYSNSVPGMTLRDYFAGQALAGLTSAHNQEGEWTGSTTTGDTAPEAYRLADAMLAERKKAKE